MRKIDLSIVIPCFNEEVALRETVAAVKESLRSLTEGYEIVVVDDGSSDGTFSVVCQLSRSDSRVQGVRFTRNFGKEAAISAGLHRARGDAVVIMDADCQHPPALLGRMVACWKEEGFDIVEAVKTYAGEMGIVSKLRSKMFNGLMSKLTGLDMQGASDYKLLNRRAVDALLKLRERNRLFRGLTKWTGYKTKQISFEVPERISGETKWSLFGLISLSISAITAFSYIPLHLITTLGGITWIVSLGLILQTLMNKWAGRAASGFTTVIILMLVLNSIVMVALGIIGIYLAKVYSEIKGRPIYLIGDSVGGEEPGRERADLSGRQLLKGQLMGRFGMLAAEIERRIEDAGDEEIAEWGQRVLQAASLPEIFREQ